MKKFGMFVSAVLLLLGSAFAQNGAFAPYVVGTVQTAPGSAATGASYNLGVGIESSTKDLLLDVNGSFNSANVTAGAPNGYTGTLEAQGYYKLFGHFLAGGGATWVINTAGFSARNFINTARESANPFVGGGFQLGRWREILTYQLPGSDALAGQRKFNVDSEFNLSKHIRFVVPLTFNSYDNGGTATLSSQRVTVTSIGAGLKFVL